jgi:hypothetical protein
MHYAIARAGVLAVVFGASISLSGCGQGGANTAVSHRVYSKPPAHVLAALDAGQDVPVDDPRVNLYSDLLSQIRSKCTNTQQEISDVTIDVVMTLQRKGVQIDIYELMKRINDAMPATAGGPAYDYKQIAAAFKSLGST